MAGFMNARRALDYVALSLYLFILYPSALVEARSAGCSLIVHSADADTPPQTTDIIRGLSQRGFSVTTLCGTRECHRTVTGLRDNAVTVEMLRLPRLVANTPLQDLFTSQESLTVLRLWLTGHRFEYAVEAAAALAGLARMQSCGSILYINHFWDGFLGPDGALSYPKLHTLLNASFPVALLDQQRLVAIWLPRGDADIPRLQLYMWRIDTVLHMLPGRELLTPLPEDGWMQEVFCSMSDSQQPLGCKKASRLGLAGRWFADASRSFHAVGYAAMAGCRGEGGYAAFREGDEFQTLASLQYLPRVDGFVDVLLDNGEGVKARCKELQQELSWPPPPPAAGGGGPGGGGGGPGGADGGPGPGGRAYVLMGARWYRLGRSDSASPNVSGPIPGWPPPEHVTPILVGFRVDRQVAKTAPLRDWFNRWGPVGARDHSSALRLKEDGVEALNVGCVTLGLRTWICLGRGYGPKPAPVPYAAVARRRGGGGGGGSAAAPMAMGFGYPTGICNSASRFSTIAGIQIMCGIRHNWIRLNASAGEALVAFDLGVRYDLRTRPGRLQLCINKLRAIRAAPLVVTNRNFHVTMPAVALGVPTLFVDNAVAEVLEDQFQGLKHLFTLLRYSNVTDAAVVARAVATARSLRVESDGMRCRADGMVTDLSNGNPGRAWRDELYRRQLAILARHAPILDAMNRLGTIDALIDDVQAADEAWIRGELPKALRPT